MREIHEIVTQPPYQTGSWQLYMKNLSTAVFDIETTGLSASRDSFVLGGLISRSQNRNEDRILSQYLAASPREEHLLLERYLSELEKHDVWISYNGDAFDSPFLAQRRLRSGTSMGIPASAGRELPLHQSLDLYRIFRRYSPLAKCLPNLRQATVETALGLSDGRTDAITGGESAALYQDYAKTGDPEKERVILLHNHDDLLLLDRLLVMFDKLDLHRILFEQGFLIKREQKKLLIKWIKTESNQLHISGHSAGIMADAELYRDGYHFSHRAENHSFRLELPYIREHKAVFFDLEALPLNTDPLAAYPSLVNGYLLFSHSRTVFYRSTNHLLQLLLTEILKEI